MYCGISKADFLEEEAPRLETLAARRACTGRCSYMENHFDKRLDPRLLVDGAKSVVSLLLNYFPAGDQQPDDTYKISKYAYGQRLPLRHQRQAEASCSHVYSEALAR